MDEALLFILTAVCWYLVVRVAVSMLKSYLEKKLEIQQEIVDKISKIVHYVVEERHGDVRYWFDKDTDAFLGQGITDDEIKSHLKERFKSHIFVLPEKEIAMLGPELRTVPLNTLAKELEA